MFWQGNYYADLALLFGVSRAPNIFNRAADLLRWILGEDQNVREDDIQHYHDDFFVVGLPNSNSCDLSLDTCLYICDDLGVAVEPLKTFRPTTCLPYLGFLFDTLIKAMLGMLGGVYVVYVAGYSSWSHYPWGIIA